MKKHFVLFIVTFSIFTLSCQNQKKNSSTSTTDESAVISEEEFDDGDEPNVQRYGNDIEHDTVRPHSQKMRRYMKKDEYSVTIENKIGKCVFLGKKPTHKTIRKGVEIYHNGSVKDVCQQEGATRWEGDGDVWVRYTDPAEIAKHIFIIQGRLQEKMDFQRK